MSTDSSQYAIFTVVADAILGLILIFLWLIQRKEKHALFWGLGQLSIMAGTILVFLADTPFVRLFRTPLCALLLTLALGGYWAGTQYFVSRLQRGNYGWPVLVLILLALGAQLLWNHDPALIVPVSGALLGAVLMWSGATLAHGRHQRYRRKSR